VLPHLQASPCWASVWGGRGVELGGLCRPKQPRIHKNTFKIKPLLSLFDLKIAERKKKIFDENTSQNKILIYFCEELINLFLLQTILSSIPVQSLESHICPQPS
jgi:hypothetical protein